MRIRNLAIFAILLTLFLEKAAPGQTNSPYEMPPPEVIIPSGLVQQAYAVADLVVPINMDQCSEEPFDSSTREDKLMELIRTTIFREDKRMKWMRTAGRSMDFSGPGSIATLQYCPSSMSLVVCQTKEKHAEIRDLLAALRRLQELEVAVELRIVRVRDVVLNGILEQTGQKRNSHKRRPTFLSEIQLFQLLEAVQGDRSTAITQLPKITLFNGQRAGIHTTKQEVVVTDLVFSEKNGKFNLDYQEEVVTTGIAAKVRPVVSADRTEVNLNLDFSLAEPTDHFSWDLISTTKQTSRCKKQETNIHRLVRPAGVNTQNLQTELNIPDGQTAVLVLGKATMKAEEARVPTLADSENRFPRPVAGESGRILVLVTPHVIVNEEEEQEVLDHGTLPPLPRR